MRHYPPLIILGATCSLLQMHTTSAFAITRQESSSILPITTRTQLNHASPLTVVDLSPAKSVTRLVMGPNRPNTRHPTARTDIEMVLNYLLGAPLFALGATLWTKVLWPRHITIAAKHGVFAASCWTSVFTWLSLAVIVAPVALQPLVISANQAPRHVRQQRRAFVKKLGPINVLTMLGNMILSAVAVTKFTDPAMHMTTIHFGLGKLIASWCAFSLTADVTFYALHRAMHVPRSKFAVLRWLARCHRQHHHQSRDGGPLASQAANVHPVEFALNNLAVLMGPVLLRAHPALFFAFYMEAGIAAVLTHSAMPIDLGHHGLHHQRGSANINFGLLGFVDRLTRTLAIPPS